MENNVNKTVIIKDIDLIKFKSLIEKNPINIATVNREGKPNLAVATSARVIDDNDMMIADYDMMHTPENIVGNPNVVLTVFNENRKGVRLTGTAKYSKKGKFFDMCKEMPLGGELKGVILIRVKVIEKVM